MKNLNKLFIATALAASLTGISAKAQSTDTWNGGNGAWSTGFTPTWTAGDIAEFNGVGTANATVNLVAPQTVTGIVVTGNQVGSVVLQGNQANASSQILNLGAGGILMDAGAGAVTVGSAAAGQVPVDLTASQTWENDSSSLLTFVNPITNVPTDTAAPVVTFTGSGSGGTQLAPITGTVGVNVATTGTGTTTFSGTSSFTGGFTLTSGIAKVTGAQSLGNATTDVLNLNGGTLILATNTTNTTAPSPIEGYTTVVGGNATIVSTATTSGSAPGTGIPYLLGTLSIGANTLTATGAGVTTATATRVQFGALTMTGNATLNATNGVSLVVGAGSSPGVNGNFNLTVESTDGTGSTSVRAQNANSTRSSGSTTFVSGSNAINVTNANVLGASTAVANLPLILQGGSLDLQSGSGIVIAQYNTTVTGNFLLTNNLAGTTETLGALSIGASTLSTNSSAASGTASNITFGGTTLTGNATLNVNNNNGGTSTALSVLTLGAVNDGGNGFSLTKTGTSTLNLNGAGTYSGGLNVQAGTVKVANATAVGTGTVTLGSATTNGTLDLNGQTETVTGLATAGTAGSQVIGNSSSGTNAANAVLAYNSATNSNFGGTIQDKIGSGTKTTGLTKSGAGTLALTGANTYTGATVVNGGTLSIGAGGSIVSNVTFATAPTGPAILNVDGTASGTINVSAGATLSGSGTTGAVTLGGANSGVDLVKANSTTGTLTVGGLTTTGGGTLTFAIGTTAGAVDDIHDTGSLTLGGSTSIVITNLNGLASQTLVAGGGTTYLLVSAASDAGTGTLSLATTTLDGMSLSLSQVGNNYYLTITGGSVVTDTGTDYFNGTSSDLTQASAYDTGLSTGTPTPSAPSATSNLFLSAARDAVASGSANSNMEVNSINFGDGGTTSNFAVSGTGTITIDATAANGNTAGSGITIAAGGGSASISNAIVLGGNQSFTPTDASSVLTLSGQISGSHDLTKSGAGTVILSNATGNTYTGITTVTSGRLIAPNTSGSATGSGAVNVTGPTAILGGSGSIAGPITLSGGGILYSGATASAVTNGPGAGVVNGTTGGLKLSSALDVNSSTLAFALANPTAASSTPALSSSFITTTGTVNFTGADAVDLVDTTSGKLTLREGQSFLLIAAGSDAAFSGLVTEAADGTLSLDGNGTVLGVYNGSGALTNFTAITINEFAADGTSVLPSATTAQNGYFQPYLVLSNGDLEVVPEPGTWALMIGGLTLLVAIQRRRSTKQS